MIAIIIESTISKYLVSFHSNAFNAEIKLIFWYCHELVTLKTAHW